MTKIKNTSYNDWKTAADFFEQHIESDEAQIIKSKDFKNLEKPVQSIILKLCKNRQFGHTLLDEPGINILGEIAHQDLSGQIIDSYQLKCLISHGGMSSVYKANKISAQSQKDVAIKLIPTELKNNQLTALFNQELETLSRLYHPNIISMHHGGVTGSGTPYLIMELIENAQEIDQYIEDKKLDSEAVAKLFIKLCEVIVYANQNDIIHQDIKPSNVLIDSHGHLQVLDFGVAALAGVKPLHQAYTVNYAAPEQIHSQQPPTYSYDSYAITGLMIKCLSLHSDTELNWQKPALKGLKLDNDLKSILSKGVSENPNSRYQSAADLAMDLRLWLKKLPLPHKQNNLLYRFKKSVARNPAIFALSLMVLSSVLLGLVFYMHQYSLAQTESFKAKQVKNILIESINKNDPDVSKGLDLTIRDMLNNVELTQLESPDFKQPYAKELYLTLAQAFHKLGDYEGAERNINNVLKIDANHTTAIFELGELAIQQKLIEKAEKQADQLKKAFHSFDSVLAIRFHLLKANIATAKTEFETAEVEFIKAQKLTALIKNPNIKVSVFSAHIEKLLEQHDIESAIITIEQAIKFSEIYFGQIHSTTFKFKAKLAETYLNLSGDDINNSISIYEKLIPQQIQLLGNDHPHIAKSLFYKATALRAMNRLPEARISAERALRIAENEFGQNHSFVGQIMMTLGALYLNDNKINKALEYANKAVTIYEQQLGLDHPDTLQYKTSYVAMLSKDQQHRKALDLLLEIHPLQTTKLGPEHRGTLYVEIVLSKTYAALNQLISAIEVGERCLINAKKSPEKNIMETYCALTLENAYFLDKRYHESIKLINIYQNEALIINQPAANKQFKDHLAFYDLNDVEVP